MERGKRMTRMMRRREEEDPEEERGEKEVLVYNEGEEEEKQKVEGIRRKRNYNSTTSYPLAPSLLALLGVSL